MTLNYKNVKTSFENFVINDLIVFVIARYNDHKIVLI